ncbi:MAG: hypothetical protein JWN94_907 [Betaproteobacteria bacterium]|nr:hypothetical protein [Betaproteobacteria bacterium]
MQLAFRLSVIAAAFTFSVSPAISADLKIGASDGVQTVLTAQKGARVTVRTRSGQDITGVMRDVNANVVQIGAVSGKEFFDAVVPLSAVDAVYVRVKE